MMRCFHKIQSSRPAEWLARARSDQSGIAAIEFALVVPLMLLAYAGAVDVTRGVIANRKLSLLSRTVSDLVSQQDTATALTPSTITSIFNASSALMAPYSTSSLKLTVSAVDIRINATKSCCNALVRWSYTLNGSLRVCAQPGGTGLTQVDNSTVAPAQTNIPSALITANDNAKYGYSASNSSYLIVTDAMFTYTPIFQQAASWFTTAMYRVSWMVPRSSSGSINLASPATAPSSSNGNTGGAICFN